MNHLFISYSRQDEVIVDRFAAALREKGYQIWQDKSGAGTGIPFSTKWFDIITEALYSAQGAIIFRSENWERSTPCKNEFDLIQKCAVPYLNLDPETLQDEGGFSAALQEVEEFYRREVKTFENSNRTELFSHAYAYQQGVDPYQLIDNIKSLAIRDHLDYLIVDLLGLSMQMKDKGYETLNPEIYPYLKRYISFARKATIRHLIFLLLSALLVIGGIILGVSAIIAIAQGSQQNETTYKGLAVAGQIEQTAETDPVLAMKNAVGFEDWMLQVTSFLTLSMNAMHAEDAVLPEQVVINAGGSGDQIMQQIKQDDPARYTVTIPEGAGSLLLTDQETGQSWSLNTPGTVDGYSWNADATRLLYWTGSRLFVYDPSGIGSPVELQENFLPVSQAGFVKDGEEEKIAALTEGDTVAVWKDPFPEKPVTRGGIGYGIFLPENPAEGASEPAAVYVDGDQVIVNRANQETILTPDLDGTLHDMYYAVSHDGTMLAVLYDQEETHVAVVELASGNVLLDVVPPYTPNALAFDPSDKMLFAAGYGCGLMKIDLGSGQVSCSQDSYYTFNIANFRDYLLLSDFYGNVILYDQDLQPVVDFRAASFTEIPFADLVPAEEKGYLFCVNRGGGTMAGCVRVNLINGNLNVIVVKSREHVDSNTAAAVSADEEFVAFGYPDGMIRIYETAQLYMACERRLIGEAVSALQFAPDRSSLYVLGESGTIYTLELPPAAATENLEDMQVRWRQQQTRMIEKGDAYYAGITDGTDGSWLFR